jgi:hypothetical protein
MTPFPESYVLFGGGRTVKKLIIFAALGAFAISGPAIGGTPGSTSNGLLEKATGKNAFTYFEPYWGMVTCNETRHARFETVSCTLANPDATLADTSLTTGWRSDFTGQLGTATLTFNEDGSNYSGHATY